LQFYLLAAKRIDVNKLPVQGNQVYGEVEIKKYKSKYTHENDVLKYPQTLQKRRLSIQFLF